MHLNCLDFEQPISELDSQIAEWQQSENGAKNDQIVIAKLERQRDRLIKSIFSNLTPLQTVQLARHPERPYVLDYIDRIFTDFDELHGDRHLGDDAAMVGGLARLDDKPVVVLGHQKGRKTAEKIQRNFGMVRPEGYRKALRIMKLAEKFQLPLLTFIDTPGAYPGIEAEEHNQSEAIARNLLEMSQLRTPIICTVTGEGGSGGALAIGVGDRLLMLQYSVYSVISPEGCASILWKDAAKAGEAAKALQLTASHLSELGLIDEIVSEPLGGAHRDIDKMAATLKKSLKTNLKSLQKLRIDELLENRYERLMRYGL